MLLVRRDSVSLEVPSDREQLICFSHDQRVHGELRYPFLWNLLCAVERAGQLTVDSAGRVGVVTRGSRLTALPHGTSRMHWLRLQTQSPKRSPRRQKLVEDVCLTHGLEFYKGSANAPAGSNRKDRTFYRSSTPCPPCPPCDISSPSFSARHLTRCRTVRLDRF
jgi:hypothetical protein